MNNEHLEKLIGGLIGYLYEILNNEPCEDIINNLKRIGFTTEDLKYFEVYNDLNIQAI